MEGKDKPYQEDGVALPYREGPIIPRARVGPLTGQSPGPLKELRAHSQIYSQEKGWGLGGFAVDGGLFGGLQLVEGWRGESLRWFIKSLQGEGVISFVIYLVSLSVFWRCEPKEWSGRGLGEETKIHTIQLDVQST